jgi:hypothetical protein
MPHAEVEASDSHAETSDQDPAPALDVTDAMTDTAAEAASEADPQSAPDAGPFEDNAETTEERDANASVPDEAEDAAALDQFPETERTPSAADSSPTTESPRPRVIEVSDTPEGSFAAGPLQRLSRLGTLTAAQQGALREIATALREIASRH